jgi:hypothetical protein
MTSRNLIAAIALSAFLPASASAITVGELSPGGNTTWLGIPNNAFTAIAFSRPALKAGTVNTATVIWANAPASGCVGSFELKFFRAKGSYGEFDVVAKRGPFDVVNGINDVPLDPPVSLNAGDWIGLVNITGPACGGVVGTKLGPAEILGTSFSDGQNLKAVNVVNGSTLNIVASDGRPILHGVLPVVGSGPGNLGSFFKTGVQLANRSGSNIRGKLVFHPAGAAFSDSDPSVSYTLGVNQTISYTDIVLAAGASGLGTMDLVLTSGQPPDVTARIYNEEAGGGTSGLTEEVMSPWQALRAGERATLTIPYSLTKFRMNIGIRTLDEETTVNVTTRDSSGTLVPANGSSTYPAKYFTQISVAEFAGTPSIPPGGTLQISVSKGAAFIYGATTDNTTQDPNLRFAVRD